MEKKDKIIIIGLFIIIIALVVIGLYMFNEQPPQSTQIKIIGNKTIEEGGALKVQLSLLNNTGIENKKINITIKDKNNKEVLKKTVKTNSKGTARVKLNNISKGNYIVNITFEGDKNYSVNNTSQKIKIIAKKVVETTLEVTNTESNQPNEESADEWEYDGRSHNAEYFSNNGGEEIVIHDQGQYEYYDGEGHVVGGFYK